MNVLLQAHRGVESECPENTFASFKRAIAQGYGIIELDPNYTKDKKIVVLHNDTIEKTARGKNGEETQKISIREITYNEALNYDFGIYFSKKFRGEKLPLLKDVLELAKKSKIRVKIDNKFENFPKEIIASLLEQLKPYEEFVSLTSVNPEKIREYRKTLKNALIEYDGEITEDALKNIGVEKEKLNIWAPLRTITMKSGKIIPGMTKEIELLAKKYGHLGIWSVKSEEDFEEATAKFSPDIVETRGNIKPEKNVGMVFDMHTHSEFSHDSVLKTEDMAKSEKEKGVNGYALTDHSDIEYYYTRKILEKTKLSVESAKTENEKHKDFKVLKGTEIGEGFWFPDCTEELLNENSFDVVISSAHGTTVPGFEHPYSTIDFSKCSEVFIDKYLNQYFDDIIKMIDSVEFDILAHLTCPLRYICGKYKVNVDMERYGEKIKAVLESIIKKGIALEINTSNIGSDYDEFMPAKDIIKTYKELGGYLITLGSDAHIAENAAKGFERAMEVLKEYGFKNIYYYEKREAIQCTLK